MTWLTGLVVPSWAKYLIGYLLMLAVIIGCVWGIYHAGVMDEHERNTAAENIKIAEYGQRVLALQTKAREDERNRVKYDNELTINYEKRLQDAQTKTNSALHDVATGTLKLRIATKGTMPACGGSTSTTSAIASAVNETTAELSQSASEFLISFASDCDTTAEKLNLAIDIAQGDRKEIHPNTSQESEVESANGRVSPSPSNSILEQPLSLIEERNKVTQ